MKIDAHQHFWQYDPVRDTWIDESMKKIRRDFMPDDLFPLLEKTGIDGTVAVQADTSEKETQFLLTLAEKYGFIKGVVGWADLTSPNLEERLEHFSQFDRLKGFRHILQSEPDGFMTDDAFVHGLKKLHNYGYTYDILIYENQLDECIDLLSRLPEMDLVIDHIAKPRIRDRSFRDWASRMKIVAGFQNVKVKLSGLVTEADMQHWDEDDFTPYLESCLEYFGPDRLMTGSDWPVCLLAAEYEEVIGIVDWFSGGLSTSEYEAITGGTATEFYSLD